jgi:uncharacterized membrane protein
VNQNNQDVIKKGGNLMKRAKTLNWLVAVAGLWEILAPFILGYSVTAVAMWNAIIIGVVLIVLAVIAALHEQVSVDRTLDWVNAALGLWLILAPFILGYSAVAAAMWNDIVVGLIVIVLAVWATSELVKPATAKP